VRRALLAVAVAPLLAFFLAAPVSAASATFGQPSATSSFGEEIVFRQEFVSPVPLARVEILIEYPGSIGPSVAQVEGAMADGSRTLVYRMILSESTHVYPNSPLTARWRLVPADRTIEPSVGPPVTITYADTRFAWKTLVGDIVRVHWYEGSNAFGRRALAIGDKAVREASAFLGVTESEPIDFYIYADEPSFYDAVGPSTRENVVGTAISEIRTMFGLIPPNDVATAEVARTVPHELTHLVFDTAVSNPYHYPPRWLNEGVATYLTEGFLPWLRASVEAAADAGRLMPLTALTVQFPSTYERFTLAYAESTSAVDYLVREQGTDALVDLVNNYADGVTDDEAFTAAIGTDVAGFEAAWLESLGADAPTELGPQPAPPGPLPPGWEAAQSAPSGASTPAPGASGTPGGSAEPDASAAPAPGGPGDDDGSPFRDGRVLLLAALAGLVVGGGMAYVRRRRATSDRTAGGEPTP
jgi:hypothetical protein